MPLGGGGSFGVLGSLGSVLGQTCPQCGQGACGIFSVQQQQAAMMHAQQNRLTASEILERQQGQTTQQRAAAEDFLARLAEHPHNLGSTPLRDDLPNEDLGVDSDPGEGERYMRDFLGYDGSADSRAAWNEYWTANADALRQTFEAAEIGCKARALFERRFWCGFWLLYAFIMATTKLFLSDTDWMR